MIIHEYETTLIFHPDAPEDEVKRINERLDGVIESFEGTKLFHDVWGVRKLAYPIRKQAHGNYQHLGFTAKAECIAEFERVIRIESHLMRFLTVRLFENVDVEERKLVASKRTAVMSASDGTEEAEGHSRSHGDRHRSHGDRHRSHGDRPRSHGDRPRPSSDRPKQPGAAPSEPAAAAPAPSEPAAAAPAPAPTTDQE